jgi:hypothetical protein
MRPFGDFLSDRLARLLPAPKDGGTSEPRDRALVVLRDSVPPAEAQQLAGSLQHFAASAEFAAAANSAIPPPRPGEPEDDFVARAKAALEKLLLDRFGR